MRAARFSILATVLTLVVAACGSSSPTASPLGSALSYFPKSSPFVMSVVTSPTAPAVKGAQAMLARIPFATFGQAAGMSRLQQLGINYDTDIRPLFGNPAVIGVQSLQGTGASHAQPLIAWVTNDAGALAALIKKLHLTKVASHAGASIYQVGPLTLAVDGATVVGGSSHATVTAALDRHAAGTGMATSEYDNELGTLPKSALLTAAGNLAGLVASPSAAKARSIPWVAALRGYGIAISAGPRGLTFQYTLDTDAGHVSSSELPLAPGSSPPGLAGDMPIQVGLRQPASTLAFLLDTERRTSPSRYAVDMAKLNGALARAGLSFKRDILGEIGNSAALEESGHTFIARVDVVNATAAARTLRQLGRSAPAVFGGPSGSRVTAGPAGFEMVRRANHPSLLFGLVGSEFVVGTGSPAQLRAFASAPAAAATGAQGAMAFRVALPQILALALHRTPSKTLGQVLSSLGDITGWLSSSPSALTGSATLGLK